MLKRIKHTYSKSSIHVDILNMFENKNSCMNTWILNLGRYEVSYQDGFIRLRLLVVLDTHTVVGTRQWELVELLRSVSRIIIYCLTRHLRNRSKSATAARQCKLRGPILDYFFYSISAVWAIQTLIVCDTGLKTYFTVFHQEFQFIFS